MGEWWFLDGEGNRVGPLALEELRAQARVGRIGPIDLVWHPSRGEWKQAIEIEGLFPVSEFERARSTYSELAALWRSGRVGEAEFREAVNRLRLRDGSGTWWQVRADDGAWLRWNGAAWAEGVPETMGGTGPFGGPHGAAQGSPRSLGEFGLMLLRGLGKSLPKRIVFAVVLFVLVWLIHTAVMVFLNDGWAKVGNWFLGMILVVRGGELGGTFFWMLLMMLVTVLITRLRREGARKLQQDIVGVGRAISWAFSRPGRWGFAVMFGFAAVTLLISFLVFAIGNPYTPNRLVSLFFAALLLLSLSSGEGGLVLLVSRLAWFDFQRLFGVKPVRLFQPEKVVLTVVGVAGGALLATVLPFLPTSGWFAVLALIVTGAIMVALGGRGVPSGGFLLLGAVLSAATALVVADQSFAHDWGWQESGRDVGRLIQSPGFGRAATHSMAAAIGAVLGALLPGAVAGVTAAAGGATPPVSAPLPPTRILQGEDALGWLQQQGLVAQTPEGGWVKTGDWGNATAPGGGMKGYVEGAQPTPAGVDPDMVILVEGEPGSATEPGRTEPYDSGVRPPDERPPDDEEGAEGTEGAEVETAEPEGRAPDETQKPPEGAVEGEPAEPETPPDHDETQHDTDRDEDRATTDREESEVPVDPEAAEAPALPEGAEVPADAEDPESPDAVPPAVPGSSEVSGVDGQEGSRQGPEPEIAGTGPALHGAPAENPHTAFEGGRTGCGPGRPGLPAFFVNTAILNLVIQDTMYRWSGLGPSVDLTLTYNSVGGAERGAFGFGWSFAYEWWLVRSGSRVTVCKGSGQREEFTLPNGATSAAGSQELLPAAGGANRLLYRGDHWEYRKKGSRLRYRFDQTPGAETARLNRVVDSCGNALAVEYDERGRMRVLVDAAGRTVSFRYGETGECTGFLLPDGREASFGYDAKGDLVRTVDLLGVVCEYSYDSDHSLTQMVVGRERRTTVFGYQGTGARKRVASVTDARGNQTRYQLMATDPVEVKATRPGGRDTLYTSRNGLTERITDPLGHYEETVFRGGLPVAYRNKNGEITEADWDEHGNVVEVRGADGSVAHYQYDAESNLVRAVGPQGESWAFTYNEQRGLTTITSPLQTVITYTYDPSGRLIALSHSSGGQTSLSYDRFGNVARTTDPQGHVTSFVYDEWGLRLISSTDVLGRTTHFEYDENDRLVRIHHPGGASQTHAYDCCAPILSVDENGSSVGYERDPLLNITRLIDRGGNHTDYRYDTESNLVEVTEAEDRRTRFVYDAAGRLVSMSDAMGRETTFAYDPAANLVGLIDPAGHETRFTYHPRSALASITDAGGHAVSMLYDLAGRPAKVINARGQEVAFAHDLEGRVTAKLYDGVKVVSYEYDRAGNLRRMIDPTGTTEYELDARGLPNSIRYFDGTQVQYTHDARGNVISLTYPGGLTATYEYDARDRVRRVHFGGAGLELRYDKAGRLTGEIRSNGRVTAYGYDEGGFFREITHSGHGVGMVTIRYERNTSGDIVEEHVSGEYGVHMADPAATFTYDELDLIAQSPNCRYRHDEDGNLVACQSRNTLATYDPENRLLSIERDNRRTRYAYNGTGDRVIVETDDERLCLHYDRAGKLLFETDGAGGIRHRYLYAADRLVALMDGEDEVFFYHADNRGSTILLTDAAGEVVTSYGYSPFGTVAVDKKRDVRNRFTYIGTFGVTDEGGGLYFMKNRYYDSAMRRFLQRDPLRFAAGTNLYAYANNNPLSLVDPLGLASCLVSPGDTSLVLGFSNLMFSFLGCVVAVGGGVAVLGGSTIAGPGVLLAGTAYTIGRFAVAFRQFDAAFRGEAVCNEKSNYSIARASPLGGLPFFKGATYIMELNAKGVAWELGKALMGDYGNILDAAEDVTNIYVVPDECVPAISGGTVTVP